MPGFSETTARILAVSRVFGVKSWNLRWFHWNRGPGRDGFIETGGRRPPCFNEFHHGPAPGFNEYHRGVSTFNPQKHVNTAKILAVVSLNTGHKKKNMRVFHLKPCFSHFWPNFSSEYHPLISYFIPSTGENSLFESLVYNTLLVSFIRSTANVQIVF